MQTNFTYYCNSKKNLTMEANPPKEPVETPTPDAAPVAEKPKRERKPKKAKEPKDQ